MEKSKVKHRIIIIDDEEDYGDDLKSALEQLGHEADQANSLERAKDKIKISYEENRPYTLATIDRNFRVSGKSVKFTASGLVVLSYIKERYPDIACIMISGQHVVPDEVLDLRDENDLDYYLLKDRADINMLKKAIERATERIKPKLPEERLKFLKRSFDNWCAVRDALLDKLAHLTLREAKKGIDVDFATVHEIIECKEELTKAELCLKAIQKDMEMLGHPGPIVFVSITQEGSNA
jgi:DNA-binding NtrC family response regulator